MHPEIRTRSRRAPSSSGLKSGGRSRQTSRVHSQLSQSAMMTQRRSQDVVARRFWARNPRGERLPSLYEALLLPVTSSFYHHPAPSTIAVDFATGLHRLEPLAYGRRTRAQSRPSRSHLRLTWLSFRFRQDAHHGCSSTRGRSLSTYTTTRLHFHSRGAMRPALLVRRPCRSLSERSLTAVLSSSVILSVIFLKYFVFEDPAANRVAAPKARDSTRKVNPAPLRSLPTAH